METDSLWLGASALLFHHGWPLFGAKVREGCILLGGIGGKVEPGESAEACLRREAIEETGIPMSIVPAARTLRVLNDGSVVWQGSGGPIAVVDRYAVSPPGQPWSPVLGNQRLRVHVYLGRLEGEPRPVEKLIAFPCLSPDVLRDAAIKGLPWKESLASGKVRVASGHLGDEPPPRARLVDSQEALVIALGDGAAAFYRQAEESVTDPS